jgi:hypothetical protein
LVGAISSTAGCTVNDSSSNGTGGGQTGSGGTAGAVNGGAGGQTAGGGGLAGTAGAAGAGAPNTAGTSGNAGNGGATTGGTATAGVAGATTGGVATAGNGGATTGGTATAGVAGVTTGGVATAGNGGATTGGTAAAGNGGATTGGTATAGSGGAAAGAGGTAGASCLGDTGTPADCAPVESIPGCGTFGLSYCNSAVTNLKPGVAQQAVACMLALTDTCGPPYDCLRSALGQACPDSTADDLCTQALASCTSDITTAAQCHALVDGLNATGRDAVVTCVEGGCSFGLWSCLEGF